MGNEDKHRERYGEAAEKRKYNGTTDAERILETVMHRQNWTVTLRDELKSELEEIVKRRGGK